MIYCSDLAEEFAKLDRSDTASVDSKIKIAQALIACVDNAGDIDMKFRIVINDYVVALLSTKFIEISKILVGIIKEKIELAKSIGIPVQREKTEEDIVKTRRFRLSDIVESIVRYLEEYPDDIILRELAIPKTLIESASKSKSRIESIVRPRAEIYIAKIVSNILLKTRDILSTRTTYTTTPGYRTSLLALSRIISTMIRGRPTTRKRRKT